MRSFDQLLRVPGLTAVTVLAGDPARAAATSVTVVEQLADLRHLPGGGVGVLTRQATAGAWGYRLDVAVREVAALGVAAVVLTGPDAPDQVAPTVAGVAERSGVVVLRAVDEPVADLVVSFAAALAGGADEQLRVVETARAALAELEQQGSADPVDAAARVAGQALDRTVAAESDAEDAVTVPVLAGAEAAGALAASCTGAADRVTVRLVLTLAAGAAGRLLAANQRREEVPIRSRSAVLGELLVASGDRLSRLVGTARSVGVPVDGWHEVVRIEPAEAADEDRDLDDVARFALLESASRLALQVARASGGSWNVAQADGAVILVRTHRGDPGTVGTRDTTRVAGRVLDRLAALVPAERQWCGVGTPHDGSTGLLASAAEARGAVAKCRALGAHGTATAYDLTGLGRMLVDWYASDSARQAVRDLLRPLDTLDRRRADAAVETLHVYLDERGSTSRAGERLHLHRNAVAYRVKAVTELLGVDLDDPDQRLALQLACRARLLR